MCSTTNTDRAQSSRGSWWRNAVFYQLDVRTFADADGDGIGDLDGLRSRLGYLELLGIDAVWLTNLMRAPICRKGDEIEPMLGDLDSFDLMLDELHAAGIRLVLDVSIPRDILDRPNGEHELDQAVRFWSDRGIDGMRVAATPRADRPDDSDLWNILSSFWPTMADYPELMVCALVAGGWDDRVLGSSVPFDLGVDVRFGKTVFDARKIRTIIETVLPGRVRPAFPPSWSLSRTTKSLTVTRFGGGERGLARSRALALVMLALPGAVGMDNGEELGLPNAESLPESTMRLPMLWEGTEPPFGFSTAPGPWSPLTEQWASLSVESQLEDEDSTLSLYRRAIELRRRFPIAPEAELEWYGAPSGCLAFRHVGGTFLCALNASGGDVPMPPGEVVLASGPLTGNGLPPDCAVWID